MEIMKEEYIEDASDKPILKARIELWKDFVYFDTFCQPYDEQYPILKKDKI